MPGAASFEVEMKSIAYNMRRPEYDRVAAINWSSLKHILRSPQHYRHALLAQHHDTDAMRIGRAVHIAALEPDRYRAEVAVWDGGRRAGKNWGAFQIDHADREIVTLAEHERIADIARAVRSNADAARYLEHGRHEVTMLWEASEPETEALPGWRFDCKSRLDAMSPLAVIDLKSCRDGSPDGFGKAAWSMGYHCQGAYYVDANECVTGVRLPYVLIAVESAPPHVVQVYVVPEAILELGRETYRACLRRLAECQRTNAWPGYYDSETFLTLPRWAAPREDEDADAADLNLEIADGE